MKSYTLGGQDLVSIAKGLGIALIGAALTYLTTVVTKMQFGQYTPVVYIFWSTVANTLRKVLDGVQS